MGNMKANRKFKEEEAVSAVIGVILMVAITVAIAATVYVYVAGIAGTGGKTKENASVAVTVDNSKIKITLTDGGNNYPTTGYTLANIRINLNGSTLAETNLADGWQVGDSFFIGGSTPAIDDDASEVGALGVGSYSITVVIMDTVVYDNAVSIT